VKLFIQRSAEQDILSQVDWYAAQGLPDIAQRFSLAAMAAIEALVATPQAGAPRACANPQLTGLRTWPIAGFDAFRVYYLVRPELLTVVRILHGKQDTGGVLQSQPVDDPSKH
jgi:plasmid stabilization system protein ParE